MSYPSVEYESKSLDHLGIVAVVFKEMKWGDGVDQRISAHPESHLSLGMCLKAMIITGLGFTTRPLYLRSSFFVTKAVGQLMGPAVKAKQITDHQLGRFLSQCYENGCNGLFSQFVGFPLIQK